jgi:hypothetical protein
MREQLPGDRRRQDEKLPDFWKPPPQNAGTIGKCAEPMPEARLFPKKPGFLFVFWPGDPSRAAWLVL